MTDAHLFAIGVVLAWLAGVRVYLTVFGVGLAGLAGWIELPQALAATESPWVLGVSGALAAAEFFADKIPGVDSGWDMLHTLLRVPVGAFLAAATLSPDGELGVGAMAAGAGVALTSHLLKAGSRALINTSPEPVSNWTASVAEDTAVLGGLALVFSYPWLALGIVVVLFQFPATIVRSFPLQGYAGTCASFTIAIILLAPNLDSDVAIDRIIDTFVGVIIYLTVEALLSTTYTENILLTNMKVVYEGIDERFAGFQKNFLLFKNYARTAARTKNASLRPTELTESSKRPAVNTAKIAPAPPPLYSLNGLHLEPIDAKIKTQHDLLRFLELDPGLRRPPR